MILTCPACTTRYEVDAAKFPPDGRTVRCAKCGHVWHAEAHDEPEPFFTPPPPEAYQQPIRSEPEVREPDISDPAPQAVYRDDSEPAAENAAPWYTQKTVLMAGWAGLAVLVLGVAVAGVVYRYQVVEAWPKSASLYSGLGLNVAASGLQLEDTKSTEAPQNGQIVLTVTGAVTNVTRKELPVPQIRVGLVDREKRELYHWTAAIGVMSLKAGQSTRFVTRLSNPPKGASSYEVRFVKAGE